MAVVDIDKRTTKTARADDLGPQIISVSEGVKRQAP
jgi:hypothetical protein